MTPLIPSSDISTGNVKKINTVKQIIINAVQITAKFHPQDWLNLAAERAAKQILACTKSCDQQKIDSLKAEVEKYKKYIQTLKRVSQK